MATPAAPPKPWRAEYNKSFELVLCRTCSTHIVRDSFSLINLVPAFKSLLSKDFDCHLASWHHASSILQMKKKIRENKYGRVVFVDNRKILDWNDVEGAETLLWRDGEKLRKYIEEEDVVGKYEVEKAESYPSACKRCKKWFDKGQVMISHTEAVGGGRFELCLQPQWHHAKCFFEEFPQAKVPGITCRLPSESRAPVRVLTSSSVRVSAPEVPLRQSALPQPVWQNIPFHIQSTAFGLLEAGHGKKRDGETDETSNKRQKTSGTLPGSEVDAAVAISKEFVAKTISKDKDSGAAVKQNSVVTDPLGKFEQQRKSLLQLKNELREHVSVASLRDMLIANGQDYTGSLDELLERCADGMLFGTLMGCCSGL